MMISSSFSILPRFLLLYEIVWILSHHLSPQFCLFGDLSPHLSPHFYLFWDLSPHLSPHFCLFRDLSHHLFHHFCLLGDLFHHLFHHFCLLGDLSHHLFHHFCLSVHFSGLCYTISMILGLYVILAAYCDFAAVGIRGNLSPPVLAKNKETAVFRLVSARTDFSSEKSSCSGPTSEGICFAKQSEQWATEPMLSQGEVSGSVPLFQQLQNAVLA